MPAQRSRRVKINGALEPGGEFVLQAEERQAGMATGEIFDQHIRIAGRGEILPQHRAEECESSDAALAAILRDFLQVHSDGQLSDVHGWILPITGDHRNPICSPFRAKDRRGSGESLPASRARSSNRRECKSRDLPQEQLAERAELNPRTLQKIEVGDITLLARRTVVLSYFAVPAPRSAARAATGTRCRHFPVRHGITDNCIPLLMRPIARPVWYNWCMTFPRHPRFRRAENFAPMELTARDADILRVVNRHRFLRSHQIAELVGGSRQQVLRRLQMLYHHGYLERPRCQLDYYQSPGSRDIAYSLASRGAAHLRRVDDIPFSRLDWTTRNRAVKRLFLEHALMVSDIMVALEIACRKRGDVRLLIEDEIPLPTATRNQRAPFQWTVTGSGKEKLGVIPDRVFALELGDKGERILYFLEADRGTMPVERAKHHASSIARKLYAYTQTWKAGIHRSRFGASRIRVLTVTSSESRCRNIRAAASAVSGGHGIFLQSHITVGFSSETCLGPIWRSTTNKLVSLMD